jgi:type I restriction enzyme R subunit
VIVEEAHASQSGKSTQALTDVLTREATSSDEVEDLIAEYQQQRSPQPNISFSAFIATPRNVTLERFVTPRPDGRQQCATWREGRIPNRSSMRYVMIKASFVSAKPL